MNYEHLSIEERSCIRKYYVDGLSYREIARLLGRNPSTISREFKRNRTHMYDMWIVNSKSDRFYKVRVASKTLCKRKMPDNFN